MAADIGEALKKSVAETFKNMDPIALMQKVIAENPEDDEGEQIRDKLSGILKKYQEMSDEEKEAFVTQMKETLAEKISLKLSQQDFKLDGLQEAIGQAVMTRLIMFVVFVVVVFILLVFFGYKLYKSIKEKELKREEKKKQKQMKKKK